MKQTLVIAFLVVLAAVSIHAKEWRGIVPLHSTRADVERLLGRPDSDFGSAVFYTVDFSRVVFHFPPAPCGQDGSFWNVASNIVTDIWVVQKPPHELRLTDIKLGRGFRTEKDPALGHILYYINDLEGISYTVDSSSDIINLTKYFPPAKENNLQCPVKH